VFRKLWGLEGLGYSGIFGWIWVYSGGLGWIGVYSGGLGWIGVSDIIPTQFRHN
jgi:hypothetical protein